MSTCKPSVTCGFKVNNFVIRFVREIFILMHRIIAKKISFYISSDQLKY